MIDQIEILRTIAWRNRPMEIYVRENHRPNGEIEVAMIANGTEVPADSLQGHNRAQVETTLSKTLRWYPEEVTLNGHRLPRTRWNGLSVLTIKEYLDAGAESYRSRPLNPGQPQGSPHPAHGHNALAGGIAVALKAPVNSPFTYLSLLTEGAPPHWGMLLEVSMKPVLEISTEELDHMDQEELDHALERAMQDLTEGRGAMLAEQIGRTKEHKDSPPPWDGPVHRHSQTALTKDRFPARIAVKNGKPLVISGDGENSITRPAATAAAAALYRADWGLVPIWGNAAPEDTAETVSLSFEVEGAGRHNGALVPAHKITMTISTADADGIQEHRIDVPLALETSVNGDATGYYIPDAIEVGELEDTLMQAYLEEDRKDWTGELESQKTRLITQAIAATEGEHEALRQNLRTLANSFQSPVAMPSTPVTSKSDDGSITVTARRPTSGTAPCKCRRGPVTHRLTSEEGKTTLTCAQCLIECMWEGSPIGRNLEEIT